MTRRLTRDTQRAALGGVASGFARYLEVDPTFVRLAFVALTFASGFGVLAYVVCWIVIPADGSPAAAATPADAAQAVATEVRDTAARVVSGFERASSGVGGARTLVGYSLMLLGAILLLDNLGWIHWPSWAGLSTLWPLILVGLGAGLVWRSIERRTS
jgi:phage shock protein C